MKFLLALILSFTIFSAHALVLVSDFDDTIKITNAGNLAAATYNGFLKTKVYSGMPELLSEMSSYTEGLHVVSAAPSIVAPRIRKLLAVNDIQYQSLNYRLLRNWQQKKKFKIETLKEILRDTGDDIILLGDDVEEDPAIFDEIQNLFPGRVLAAYVHVIKQKQLPSSVTPYYTSFDLALYENLAGRMDSQSVARVFNSLLEARNLKRTFPGFSHCPKSEEDFSWQKKSGLDLPVSRLVARIVQFCSLR